jgi:perosamine synthetase
VTINNALERTAKTYCDAAARHFEFFKQTTLLDDLYAKSLRLADGAGYLLPTCALHLGDDELIATLTNWRNTDVAAYPSQFTATPASTRSVFRDRDMGAPERMVFL